MKNNTFYFDHDYNAQNDPKIEAMLFEKGWEGYGIFWAIIEKLAQEPCHKLLKLYDRIAFVLRTKFELVKSIVEDYKLFQIDDQFFWSERLNKHFEKRAILAEKGRIGGLKRVANSKPPLKPALKPPLKPALKPALKPPLDDPSSIKENKIKEKENKDKDKSSLILSLDGDKSPKNQNQKINSFKSLSEHDFMVSLAEYEKEFSTHLIFEFGQYWTEKNSNGVMKFQLQETWDTKKRLIRWQNNQNSHTENKLNKSQRVEKMKEKAMAELAVAKQNGEQIQVLNDLDWLQGNKKTAPKQIGTV
jgi:hypothetical protein